MPGFALRLDEDRLAPGAALVLPAAHRVLYLVRGDAAVDGAAIAPETATHRAAACRVSTRAGATLLRYELVGGRAGDVAVAGAPGVETRRLLEHAIALDAATPYLMRCDRVDFDPGGEALPHGHRGGGIRCLIAGEIEVRIAGRPGHVMKTGEAWFETGVEPVHAIASRERPTAFIRVAILPREIRGRSSIVYVDPAHAAVKPRTYTLFVDEPIEL